MFLCFTAGADTISTNTYQADIELFQKHLNVTHEEAYNLIKKAAEMAKTAVERYLEEFPGARKFKIIMHFRVKFKISLLLFEV